MWQAHEPRRSKHSWIRVETEGVDEDPSVIWNWEVKDGRPIEATWEPKRKELDILARGTGRREAVGSDAMGGRLTVDLEEKYA